jgi:hypothetical protein
MLVIIFELLYSDFVFITEKGETIIVDINLENPPFIKSFHPLLFNKSVVASVFYKIILQYIADAGRTLF